MKIRLKTVLYWLSIVRPITDIVLGAWQGIEAFLKNVKLAKENESISNLSDDMEGKLPSDLDDFQKIDFYFNRKENLNGKD